MVSIYGIWVAFFQDSQDMIVAGRLPDGELHGHGGQHERPDQGLPEGQLPDGYHRQHLAGLVRSTGFFYGKFKILL